MQATLTESATTEPAAPWSVRRGPALLSAIPMREDWLKYLWYETVYGLATTTFALGFSLRVEGARHVPPSGPALLLANHESFLDPPLIGVSTHRHLCFLARKTLFNNPFFGAVIRSLNAEPIDQEGFAREGLKTTIEQLQAGRAVVVFPEGERTLHGAMNPLRPGVTLLLKKAPRMPVVPIGIAGAYEALPRGRGYPHLAPLFWPATHAGLAVVYGAPIDSQHFADKPREQVLEELFQAIQAVQLRAEKLRRQG